ncbi:MAG: hypothetical protein EBR88_07580, partial [Betaproteobacteria bacterium]|nr:hypothetical protein [Betaproteobacteria bacterium]
MTLRLIAASGAVAHGDTAPYATVRAARTHRRARRPGREAFRPVARKRFRLPHVAADGPAAAERPGSRSARAS